MSYYVTMKIDNYILQRYGFEAWIHATVEEGKEVFYAKLFKGEYDECEVSVDDKFPTFTEANNFLRSKVKEIVVPYIDYVRVRGNWAKEDLQTIENDFKL
jgi:hypothetical protein